MLQESKPLSYTTVEGRLNSVARATRFFRLAFRSKLFFLSLRPRIVGLHRGGAYDAIDRENSEVFESCKKSQFFRETGPKMEKFIRGEAQISFGSIYPSLESISEQKMESLPQMEHCAGVWCQ